MAAVLRYGPTAALSHLTAAVLWGIARSSSPAIHITVPGLGRAAAERPIVLHRVRTLDPSLVVAHAGFPITSVERTLLDLAETVSPQRLRRAAEEAERRRLLDMHRLESLIAGSTGRHGLPKLTALFAAFTEPQPTREELEHNFLTFCRSAGLPEPQINAVIAGHEVDAVWPAHLIAVELDSWRFHSTRSAFEADRARDADLALEGYRTIRITWRRLMNEPGTVTTQLRRLLRPTPS